jgi:hypothetical protein
MIQRRKSSRHTESLEVRQRCLDGMDKDIVDQYS